MRPRIALAVALLVSLSLVGCATTFGLQPSTRTPAAAGVVEAKLDQNGNTTMTIKANYLPLPATLDPALNTFVVWVRPSTAEPYRNVGQMVAGEDRSGKVETSVPYKGFDVLVTVETSGTTTSPRDFVILTGYVNQR